ncbi:ANK REP REGION domain-containing protein [Citrus sinensis]|uniref:ANK REP REGION domain-containing protein n=1 Tax=Citrus sinensis TaxID=2711 RepID=A0ACB8I5Y7_CITSI|nr:ANK REP REGION domain-containing protein [Citrus sinensis]
MSSSLSGSDNQNAETRRAGLLSVREKNFELMDSLYKVAVEGHTDQFRAHSKMLDQIFTPNENTILHIHITARPNQTMKPNNKLKSSLYILEMSPGLLLKANTKGETLLHIAGRHGHVDIVKDLIAECKKPHQNDPEKVIEAATLMLGMTNEAKDKALHEAVRYNRVEVVKMVTKEDPSLPYDANNAGETPLYLAAERGYKDVMQDIFLTCKSPAGHGPMGRTALHAVAFRNDTEMTKVLLESSIGTQTSKVDQQGWRPLHLAAHLGYYDVVKELLKADKSAAYKADNEGKIPLHLAAEGGMFFTLPCIAKVEERK